MARGRKTPDDVQASIMAALLAGQGVTEVAKQFDIPHQTVSGLKSVLDKQLGDLGIKRT